MGMTRTLVLVAVTFVVIQEYTAVVSPMSGRLPTVSKRQSGNSSTLAGSTVTEGKCQAFHLTRGLRVKYLRRYARFNCDSPFIMYGSKRVVCVGGVWTGSQPLCIASRCPDVPIGDSGLSVTRRYQGALLVFSCPPGMSIVGDNQLSCDGEKWSGSVPICTSEEAERSCGFEKTDLCGWTNDINSTLSWTRTNGSTPTNRTGPSTGHSPVGISGYYLYMESSGHSGRDDVARLLSPWYRDIPKGTCFQFFYHMLGDESQDDFSSLYVYVRDHQVAEELMFTTTGSHGDRWVRGLISLTEDYQLLQIVIQATRTTNWAHDVAIDDVRLYNCSYDDIELSTDVTSVTDHIGSSPAAIETTTPGHVTRHITDSTTPDKILTENSTKDNVTQTPSGGKSPNSSNDQNDFKIQKSADPDNFTHFISENVSIANWAKTGTKLVVRSSRTPMSKNELYTLYTGIIVTVVIILLLLLTILVGVQVQWRKKRVPRDQTNEEVIEMETLKEYKVNMDPTDTTCSTKESASDNLISEHAPHNENVIFCTRL